MTVISTPATPPHVVPHNLRGKWEGDALPPARGWHASKLHQQHGTTIWSWGGPPLSAERYKNALDVDFIQDSNNLSWPITFMTAFALLGLKESPGMPWAHSSLLAETIDEARRQLGVTYEQDNLQWCVLSNSYGADQYSSSSITICLVILKCCQWTMTVWQHARQRDPKTQAAKGEIYHSSLIVLFTCAFLTVTCKNVFCYKHSLLRL